MCLQGADPPPTPERQSVRRWTLDVRRSTFAQRPGFTLVEMLVVIFVILAVTVMAIGIAAPNVQTRRLREVARQVDAFLQGAKATAASTGRPYAVIVEPDENQPLMARTLKYAQVPPPYAGDTLGSMAAITAKPTPQTATVWIPSDYPWMSPSDPQHDLVRVGDLVRFNFQGHYYLIVNNPPPDPNNRVFTIAAVNTTGVITHPIGVPMPYQVFRQPVPSAGTDLELAEPVVIDLGQSGPEGGLFPNNPPTNPPATTARPLVIVFAPGGGVLQYIAGGVVYPVAGPLYLSVGKREQVETGDNLLDFQTFWVSVHNQTGLVSTAENAGVRGGTYPLDEARDFARKALSKGSR